MARPEINVEYDISIQFNNTLYTCGNEAKQHRRMIEEFIDLVSDHRSMDHVSLSIREDVTKVCSNCGNEWETMGDDDIEGPYCGWCGAIVEDNNE